MPGKDVQRAGELLTRDFTALAPDRRWVGDFTYKTRGGSARARLLSLEGGTAVVWPCSLRAVPCVGGVGGM